MASCGLQSHWLEVLIFSGTWARPMGLYLWEMGRFLLKRVVEECNDGSRHILFFCGYHRGARPSKFQRIQVPTNPSSNHKQQAAFKRQSRQYACYQLGYCKLEESSFVFIVVRNRKITNESTTTSQKHGNSTYADNHHMRVSIQTIYGQSQAMRKTALQLLSLEIGLRDQKQR